MKPGLLIIDGNSLGYGAQNAPKLTAGERETQAIFGFLRSARLLALTYPHHAMVVLWDGHPQWRYDLYPRYKADRDKNPKMAAMRESFRKQRPEIHRALRHLGIRQMTGAHLEADDLAALLVREISKTERHSVVVSGDGDWMQLVNEYTDWYDPLRDRKASIENFFDMTGYKTPQAFVEGKCLAGDTSDKINGVGGIGEEGAPVILAEYGSVANMLALATSVNLQKLPKKVRDFVVNARGGLEIYERNRRLMDLSLAPTPKKGELHIDHGKADIDAFREFCEEFAFFGIINNLHWFLEAFSAFRNQKGTHE